jgi:cobalamin biosynthesis protein CobT
MYTNPMYVLKTQVNGLVESVNNMQETMKRCGLDTDGKDTTLDKVKPCVQSMIEDAISSMRSQFKEDIKKERHLLDVAMTYKCENAISQIVRDKFETLSKRCDTLADKIETLAEEQQQKQSSGEGSCFVSSCKDDLDSVKSSIEEVADKVNNGSYLAKVHEDYNELKSVCENIQSKLDDDAKMQKQKEHEQKEQEQKEHEQTEHEQREHEQREQGQKEHEQKEQEQENDGATGCDKENEEDNGEEIMEESQKTQSEGNGENVMEGEVRHNEKNATNGERRVGQPASRQQQRSSRPKTATRSKRSSTLRL